MNSTKIFTHELDDFGRDWGCIDSVCRVNDRVDEAIANINDTRALGSGYAEENPELLAGFVLALTIDYNAHLLNKTLQEGLAAIVAELRTNGRAER